MMFLWDTSKDFFISEAELVLYMCYVYRIRKYSILQKYKELIKIEDLLPVFPTLMTNVFRNFTILPVCSLNSINFNVFAPIMHVLFGITS